MSQTDGIYGRKIANAPKNGGLKLLLCIWNAGSHEGGRQECGDWITSVNPWRWNQLEGNRNPGWGCGREGNYSVQTRPTAMQRWGRVPPGPARCRAAPSSAGLLPTAGPVTHLRPSALAGKLVSRSLQSSLKSTLPKPMDRSPQPWSLIGPLSCK